MGRNLEKVYTGRKNLGKEKERQKKEEEGSTSLVCLILVVRHRM